MRCNRGVRCAIGLFLALVLGVVQSAAAEGVENELLEELQEPAYELPAAPVQALTPPGRFSQPRVKAFLDYLAE